MWIRTVSGWIFFDVKYTIQGIPLIIPNNYENYKKSIDYYSKELNRLKLTFKSE
jgi:hypothetical protein